MTGFIDMDEIDEKNEKTNILPTTLEKITKQEIEDEKDGGLTDTEIDDILTFEAEKHKKIDIKDEQLDDLFKIKGKKI